MNLVAVVNVRDVPDKLHRQAKVQAAMEGITLKALVEKTLEEYLEKANKKGE